MKKVLLMFFIAVFVSANSLFVPQKNNVIDLKKENELHNKRVDFFKNQADQAEKKYNSKFKEMAECEKNAKNEIEKEKCYGVKLKENKNNNESKFNPEEILNGVKMPNNQENVKDIDKFKNNKLTKEQLNQIKEYK